MTGKALATLFAMLLLFAAGILAGVALMLTAFGNEASSQLDDQVRTVQRDFDRQVRGLRGDLRDELDRRLGPTGSATP